MWTRLDDGFTEHPKLAQVGPLGMALQVAGLVYSNRNLTDGFIPFGVARTLLQLHHEDPAGRRFHVAMASGMVGWDPHEAIELLITWMVEAHLWDEVAGGYLIHDFPEYNLTKEEVLARREQRAESGKKGGLAKAKANAKQTASNGSSKRSSKRSSKEVANLYPVPVPVPVPDSLPLESQLLAASAAKMNGNPKSPSDTQTYLIGRLRDVEGFSEAELPWSAIVKLNGEYGRPLVTTALQFLHEAPPVEPVENPVAYLTSTIRYAQGLKENP